MSQPIPETKDGIILEIDAWEEIIHSPSWKVYTKFLQAHCEYLQKEVNRHVEAHEDRQAGEAYRALKEARKIGESIRVRLENLRKEADKK